MRPHRISELSRFFSRSASPSCCCFWVRQAFRLGIYSAHGTNGLQPLGYAFLLTAIPKMGNPKNKSQKLGMFLTAEKPYTKHHKYHAFHHKLTTLLPSKNTTKSQKPSAKPCFPPPNIFPKNQPWSSGFRHQSR
jgi:hypothetical protein